MRRVDRTARRDDRRRHGVQRSRAVDVHGQGAVPARARARRGRARARPERLALGGVRGTHARWTVRRAIRRVTVREIRRSRRLRRARVESTHVVRVGESSVRRQRGGARARDTHVRIAVARGGVQGRDGRVVKAKGLDEQN